ncbi:hypothetical protein GGR51DRAFT_45166 [Nemania sp. FL0031]|nr:hypothetical protein GGR51DRAFT_45166 [Nemania sp. FL0031]
MTIFPHFGYVFNSLTRVYAVRLAFSCCTALSRLGEVQPCNASRILGRSSSLYYSLAPARIWASQSGSWGPSSLVIGWTPCTYKTTAADDLIQSHYLAHWRLRAQLVCRWMLRIGCASHWALIVGRGNNKACSYSAAGVPASIDGGPGPKMRPPVNVLCMGGQAPPPVANWSRRLVSTTYDAMFLPPALARARSHNLDRRGLGGSIR